MRTLLIAPLFAILAVACSESSTSTSSSSSGGPDAGTGDSSDTCGNDGSLDVKINGLPAGAKAKITITGNGQTKSVDAAQKLSLGTGSYDVKAEIVTSSDEV